MYNYLWHCANVLYIFFASKDILKNMKDKGEGPNLRTFNAILYMLSRTRGAQEELNQAMQVLSEMKICGLGMRFMDMI